MVTSERLRSLAWALLVAACAGCTLTGLGSYEVATCSEPAGTGSSVQPVGSLQTASMASINGTIPVAAFIANACVEAVGPNGFVQTNGCTLLGGSAGLAPTHPWVVPLGGGYAAAAVATTAPCTQGQLTFQSITASGAGTPAHAACVPGAGAALPSVVPLPDGSSALVAWYEAPVDTRGDPIASCATASAAPLRAAVVTGANTGNPAVSPALSTLTTQSISVRPPAMTALQGSSQVLVAAPDGDGVSLWTTQDGKSIGTPVPIPGLAQARAVSIASATDGSGRIAIVAELGCAPQAIALAVGTLADGFGSVTTIATPDDARFAVQPSVAWVPSQNYWIVSWISAAGGTHALAQRFDASGSAVGGVIDPGAPAIAAVVGAGVTPSAAAPYLFAYEPSNAGGSFVRVSLGCAQ